MCEILYAYNPDGLSDKQKKRLSQAFKEMSWRNRDGFGALADRDHYIKSMRVNDICRYIMNRGPTKELILHARIGTSGKKDTDNAHPLIQPDLLLLHNGIVSGLGNEARSDSAAMCEALNGKTDKETGDYLSALDGSWSLFLFNRADKTLKYTLTNATFKAAYIKSEGLFIAASKLDKVLAIMAPGHEKIEGYSFDKVRDIGYFQPKDGVIYALDAGKFAQVCKYERKARRDLWGCAPIAGWSEYEN